MRTLLLAVGVLGCSGCGKNNEGGAVPEHHGTTSAVHSGGSPTGPVIEVEFVQLLADYSANQFAADQKYKGKRVRIPVISMDEIGKDASGKPVMVSLWRGSNTHKVRMVFVFDDTSDPTVLSARPGRSQPVEGICRGRTEDVAGLPPLARESYWVVRFDKSVLLPPVPPKPKP